jgi:predicted ArsR family transcriptional regulator
MTDEIQETRRRILRSLWDSGALGVDDLAGRLGLSTMTVRHHIGVLLREGRIVALTEANRGRPGRPRQIFRLTPQGAETFPGNAAQLAGWLVAQIKSEEGSDRLECLLRHTAESLAAEFVVPPAATTAQRLDQIVAFLNNRGYQAGWEVEDQGAGSYVLWTGPCPYRWLVQQNPEMCDLDQTLLARLIGGFVERLTTHAPAGYHSCAYRLIWPLTSMPAAQKTVQTFSPKEADK